MKGEIGSLTHYAYKNLAEALEKSTELLITFVECRRMKLSNLLELWKDRLLLLHVLLS